MTNKTNGSSRKKRCRRKPKKKRHYMLDEATLADLNIVQLACRASSEVEAVRRAIRKMAQLVRHANKGRQIQVVDPEEGQAPIVVDIPRTVEAHDG